MGFLGLRERRLACSSTSTIQNLMASDNDFICLAHHSAAWVGHISSSFRFLRGGSVLPGAGIISGSLPWDWWLVANDYNRASIHSFPSHLCVTRETGKSVSCDLALVRGAYLPYYFFRQ